MNQQPKIFIDQTPKGSSIVTRLLLEFQGNEMKEAQQACRDLNYVFKKYIHEAIKSTSMCPLTTKEILEEVTQ